MNKGIIIGIVVAIIIIGGGIVLAQNNDESNSTDVTDEIKIEQTEPKRFEIGLTESVGIVEKP